MKKRKLFTALAAAVLLTTSGSALVNNVNPTYAATKKAKKSNKAKKSTYATINIKRGARAYKIVFNKKGNKIKKVTLLKVKGKTQALRGGKSPAIWSTKYKKVTYYYIGNSGKTAMAVRAKDAKRVGKKKVQSLTSYIKKNQAARKAKVDAANATLKNKANDWQNKLDAAKPQTVAAKTNTETSYFNVDDSGKATMASDKMQANTAFTILFKIPDALSMSDGSKVDAYYAQTSDKKIVVIPVSAVTLDNSGAKVLTQSEYEAAVKAYNDMGTTAKADIEQTKKDLEKTLLN